MEKGKKQVQPGFGSGIYTYHEAARLLNVHPTQVRRWAEGYVYTFKGRERTKKPVLQRVKTAEGLLTFNDLIELFFVRELSGAGVNMEDIRATSELLSRELDTPYPFACEKVFTDGVQILREAGGDYENVAARQMVFQFIREFFKDIEFDDDCRALRWYPLGTAKPIVLDPQRSFGTPIDLTTGVRTDVLYLTYKAQKDVDAVADWYEVSPEAVEAAIEFEVTWPKAA